MVKTSTLSTVALAGLCAFAVSGCAIRGPFIDVKSESLEVLRTPAAPFLSLASAGGRVYGVFADRSTTTLDFFAVPDGPHLPSAAPVAEVIDKVDIAAPLSPAFGEHVFSAVGGTEAVLYLDRKSDAKSVLKLATRAPGDAQWSLDILEPSGDPLALVADEAGGFATAWSGGLLSYRPSRGPAADVVPAVPFQLQGRPSLDGAGGFTAFDALTAQLLFMRWSGAGFTTRVVPGGSRVQASLRSASGKLRVLTWDARARRLMLMQESPDGTFKTGTVTVCDGTGGVAILPGRDDSTSMLLFDETRSLGAGRVVSQVSLIAPGSLLGGRGTRYRKAVLASGDARIDGFAAARSADALYVLVSQGSLKLLRIPLTP
jgi:hypothetical protein